MKRFFSVVQMLITLLESSEREVVFCACGALINLMVDSQNREILSAEKGAQKYVFSSSFAAALACGFSSSDEYLLVCTFFVIRSQVWL